MYLEVSFVTVSILFIITCYIIWNLMKKTELLETWVEDFTEAIESVQRDLTQIDSKGYFEEDDEVGDVFKQIKEIVKKLDSYKGEEQ
jgi:hypothetical protein